MSPEKKNLESIDDHRPLLQFQCFVPGHGGLQRHIRFRNSITSHAYSLEVANAEKEKDLDDDSLCDRFSVGYCLRWFTFSTHDGRQLPEMTFTLFACKALKHRRYH